MVSTSKGNRLTAKSVTLTELDGLECPGHCVLRGTPETRRLRWVDGQLAPEDAIFQDFVNTLSARPNRWTANVGGGAATSGAEIPCR